MSTHTNLSPEQQTLLEAGKPPQLEINGNMKALKGPDPVHGYSTTFL